MLVLETQHFHTREISFEFDAVLPFIPVTKENILVIKHFTILVHKSVGPNKALYSFSEKCNIFSNKMSELFCNEL